MALDMAGQIAVAETISPDKARSRNGLRISSSSNRDR
jgi:hypothetical protein